MYKEVIDRTFTESGHRLPSKDDIKSAFILEHEWDRINTDFGLESVRAQHKYRECSLVILSDEFLVSLQKLVKKLKVKSVVELSCGAGWFYYWMKKYNIPVVDAVDNYSWGKTFEYLPLVKKYDSPTYVKEHKEIDMFVLSWPYMDDVAVRIWNNMRKGQYLFYVGESIGNACATDDFFLKADKHIFQIDHDFSKNFQSFFGLHDRPVLYKK